jgi:hypothetical protein
MRGLQGKVALVAGAEASIPGPSARNTRPGREASRHSPQSASWSERDGGLDTAR